MVVGQWNRVRAKFDDLAAGVQKYKDALEKFVTSRPSGVAIDSMLSMAIAIHIVNLEKMNYDAKSFPCSKWKNYMANNVLKNHPKFPDEGTTAEYIVSSSSERPTSDEGRNNGNVTAEGNSPTEEVVTENIPVLRLFLKINLWLKSVMVIRAFSR